MRRAVLLGSGFCLAAVLLAFAGDSTVIEEIVARVNNAIITRSEYQRAKAQTAQELKQQEPDATPEEITKKENDVLRDMIDQQLLLQKGQDLGITADTDVIKQLDDVRKQMNLDSMEALQKAAEQQGITWEDYKQGLKNRIITEKVIGQEVGSHLAPTEEETKKFYEAHKQEMVRPEAVRLSEIMISTEPRTVKDEAGNTKQVPLSDDEVASAEAKAKQVLAEIQKGTKFSDAAKQYSQGPTKDQGGDLGYFERGKLSKDLEDLTFGMKVGTVSDVIRTKQGFIILKVTDHPAGGVPPLKDVQDQVQNAVYMQKMEPALREYLTKLREDAYIDIKSGYVDTGASPNQTKPVITTAAVENAKSKLKRKKRFLIF